MTLRLDVAQQKCLSLPLAEDLGVGANPLKMLGIEVVEAGSKCSPGCALAQIGGSMLAVHGGLSPSIHHLDQIRLLDRFLEIPHDGPLADLVWSDPDPDKSGFVISPRGAGYVFGQDVAQKFLHVNQLSHIVRAHQLCMAGYQVLFDDTLSTVWSAPNYCYRFGNTASILEISEEGSRFFNVFGPAPESERWGLRRARS
ncbi:unnamed protein product [Symbiodinium natans]|uniref:protein-serine/threonine phosphatase n=1 Tax=Symbiodinium natans TaxID=878477 RepID=A0A812I9A6_9DINO|nr:unnamed protein product [Symbiodinium natans]